MKDLSNILFIDIETVSGNEDYHDLPDNIKPLWDRKASYQREFDGYNESKLYYQKAGIFAEFGKIIVISIGQIFLSPENEWTIKTKSFKGDDEKALLLAFKQVLQKYPKSLVLCGHNVKEFDFPYICRRMLVNGMSIPPVLNSQGKKPWEVSHQDTMELWKFGDFKSFTSLDLLANILGLPSSKDDMDGSQVNEFYYKHKDLDSIARYCEKDVVTTAYVYLKLTRPEEQIDLKVVQ